MSGNLIYRCYISWRNQREVRVVTSFQGIWDASSPKRKPQVQPIWSDHGMRQEIKRHGTMPGSWLLESRSCAVHDPMYGSLMMMTGGSSANGQAGEQPVWSDHGICQQHWMMAGGRVLGSYACAAHCHFFFF
ncbi:hypothetical protein B9Z55_009564 [Caenorhabditis nigoni]|uniref:Uncharacterized protein n=1 Tax=Caenorhabditis nigoni TaxID=1611254 RepID=A0A2G5UT09_9PELO|nr:hypothetical protein B9Z55_009564 [Caenorhabditis nigoni]